MPFKSSAQQKFAYANPEKFGGKKGLKEWSNATDFSSLPARKNKFSYVPKKRKTQ